MARIDLHLSDGLAEALTDRSAELELSRNELIKRLCSAFVGYEHEMEHE